nr:hypothetical protein CFP56_41423 [Quercus suber]
MCDEEDPMKDRPWDSTFRWSLAPARWQRRQIRRSNFYLAPYRDRHGSSRNRDSTKRLRLHRHPKHACTILHRSRHQRLRSPQGSFHGGRRNHLPIQGHNQGRPERCKRDQETVTEPNRTHGFQIDPLLTWLGTRLTPITSQHALTTQTIEIAEDGQSAKATTYFTGIHFGKGKWEGQQVTAWGKYVDVLQRFEGPREVPGASGKWRIVQRECGFMGRLGEEGVMEAD